jgi:hypothetical protein
VRHRRRRCRQPQRLRNSLTKSGTDFHAATGDGNLDTGNDLDAYKDGHACSANRDQDANAYKDEDANTDADKDEDANTDADENEDSDADADENAKAKIAGEYPDATYGSGGC